MRDFIYFMMQSSLLVGLVLLTGRLGKRFLSAHSVYCLWLIPMVRLCIPFFFVPVALPAIWGNVHPYALARDAAEYVTDIGRAAERSMGSAFAAAIGRMPDRTAVLADGAAGWQEDGLGMSAPDAGTEEGNVLPDPEAEGTLYGAYGYRAVRWLWLAGCLITGTIMLYRNIRFFKWIRKGAVLLGQLEDASTDDVHLLPAVRDDRARLPVYYKKELVSPCLTGLLHPAVFVNERAMQDPEILKMVLLHERMHYLQKDHIWNFCRNLLCVLYWFHPLVWWGAVTSVHDAELSCDERVVERMDKRERKQYGIALIELLNEERGRRKALDAAMTMTGGKKEMAERIYHIAKRRKTRRGALGVLLTILLMTGIVGCTKAPDAATEFFTGGKVIGAYQCDAGDVGRLTFYDADFKVVMEYQNVRLEEFSENYYCLLDLDTGLYGYVDDEGTLAIPFTYSLAKGFHNGYASVLTGARQELYYEDETVKMYNNVDGCWGIIDKQGNYAVEPREEFFNSFDRDDLGEVTEHYINGPVEFSQVREDGFVEFVVRQTGKVLMQIYICIVR